MTAGEVIAQADELRPNAFATEQKLRWLRRLDGQILAELELTHGPARRPPCHCEPAPAVIGAAACPLASEEEGERSAAAGLQTGPAATDGAGQDVLPDPYEAETALLAPFPWGEGLYLAWLFCQIDLHNGEIQRYNQSLALLASAWRSLADWINRRRFPLGARAWRM